MKRIVLALAFIAFAAPALAAQPKTYQVTGPVLELTADTITVQKGSDKWEIARTADTKVTGELKKGDKVTIEYRMTAATIESKAAPTKAPAKK
jgi:hypothetical protein